MFHFRKKQRAVQVCPHCNAPADDDALFCVVCGKSFSEPVATPLGTSLLCPGCGTACETDASFCAVCGMKLINAEHTLPVSPAVGRPKDNPVSLAEPDDMSSRVIVQIGSRTASDAGNTDETSEWLKPISEL